MSTDEIESIILLLALFRFNGALYLIISVHIFDFSCLARILDEGCDPMNLLQSTFNIDISYPYRSAAYNDISLLFYEEVFFITTF